MTDLLGTALKHVNNGGSMLEAEFYDHAMTGKGEPAMLILEESPWEPIYKEAAWWIPNSCPVVDLGCGTGRFVHQILLNGNKELITGIDFSGKSLEEAKKYLVRREYGLANVEWKKQDLREWEPDTKRHGRTVYTCLEVMEHLEDDLDLVRRIPPGHQFIFSVPNYLSASHLRTFRGPADVWERYSGMLSIRRYSLIEFSVKNVVHVVDSVRRNDSW